MTGRGRRVGDAMNWVHAEPGRPPVPLGPGFVGSPAAGAVGPQPTWACRGREANPRLAVIGRVFSRWTTGRSQG